MGKQAFYIRLLLLKICFKKTTIFFGVLTTIKYFVWVLDFIKVVLYKNNFWPNFSLQHYLNTVIKLTFVYIHGKIKQCGI